MAVVARPIPHRNFDGKVFMERVSKTKYIQKETAHKNFSDDAIINDILKFGEWRTQFHDEDIMVQEMIEILVQCYLLEDAISDRIEIYYTTKIGMNGNTKNVVIPREEMIMTKKYALIMTKTYLLET